MITSLNSNVFSLTNPLWEEPMCPITKCKQYGALSLNNLLNKRSFDKWPSYDITQLLCTFRAMWYFRRYTEIFTNLSKNIYLWLITLKILAAESQSSVLFGFQSVTCNYFNEFLSMLIMHCIFWKGLPKLNLANIFDQNRTKTNRFTAFLGLIFGKNTHMALWSGHLILSLLGSLFSHHKL